MSHCDHNEALHPTRMDIPPEIRLYVIQLLNQTLACTVELRFHVKQAGWNVRGPDFAPLQALFATMASELEAYADLVAERIAVLGGMARGTTPTAAMQSRVAAYPDAVVDGRAHVVALAERFRTLPGDAGRHYSRRGCRGCGQRGGLHRHLARGR